MFGLPLCSIAAPVVSQNRRSFSVYIFHGLMTKLKVGRNVAIMRQAVPRVRDQNGTGGRQSIVPGRNEGFFAVYSRLPGAIARGIFVILLIILPSALLPSAMGDARVVVMLVALFAAIFTIAEYSSESPSLIEFRDAPPFNRIRFIALFTSVFAMSVILSGEETGSPSTFVMFFDVIGERIGASIDFPFSPVRLMLVMMPEETPMRVINSLRTAAGLSYFISLLSLGLFIALLRGRAWPRRTQKFNVWVNLPTFDPTAGGDVVDRLNRDSLVNLMLGFLLPFIIPALLKVTSGLVNPINLDDPQTLIWTVAIWAFLPASLLMRGIALSRVAGMIHVQRKKAYAAAAAEGMLPV